MHIEEKTIKGHRYLYAVRSGRVDGKPRRLEQIYLGKLEDLVAAKQREAKPASIRTHRFGAVASLWALSQELGIREEIDRHCSVTGPGASIGTYLALAAINRSVDVRSKRGFAEWYEHTSLPRLGGVPSEALTSQDFWTAPHWVLASGIGVKILARSHKKHADETSWPVFVPVQGKDNHHWWLWVFVGADSVCYLIKPRRASSVVAEHLGIDLDSPRPALPHGEAMVLHSDRYSAYDSLGLKVPEVTNLWCWAHVRRDFVRVREGYAALRPWTDAWLERIAGLYRAYGQWGAVAPDSPQAVEHGRLVAALVEKMRQTLDRELADRGLQPPARKVLQSLDRLWEGLALPFQEPGLPLDNNAAERALRGPVVGRKNYYGSGARWSAELAADAWTLLGTAAMAGWEPRRYLLDYLQACAEAGGKPPANVEPWLPWTASADDRARRTSPVHDTS